MIFSINRLFFLFIILFSPYLHSQQIISFEEDNTVLAIESLKNETFAVGLQDGTLQIFSCFFNDGKFFHKQTLENHSGKISLIINLGNNTFASSSEDGTICIWHDTYYSSYPCEAILVGHSAAAYDVTARENNILISRSHDDTLKLWVKDENGIYTCQVTLDDFPDIENITAMVSSSNEYNHNSGTLSLSCKDQQSKTYVIANYLDTISRYISNKINEKKYSWVRSKHDPEDYYGKIYAFIPLYERNSSLAGYLVKGFNNTIILTEQHICHTMPDDMS